MTRTRQHVNLRRNLVELSKNASVTCRGNTSSAISPRCIRGHSTVAPPIVNIRPITAELPAFYDTTTTTTTTTTDADSERRRHSPDRHRHHHSVVTTTTDDKEDNEDHHQAASAAAEAEIREQEQLLRLRQQQQQQQKQGIIDVVQRKGGHPFVDPTENDRRAYTSTH